MHRQLNIKNSGEIHDKTLEFSPPAQIGLRWATQKGISVIPKSVHPDRIRSNGNIFDFTIEQEDMDLIDTLNENFHSSHIPEDLRDIAF